MPTNERENSSINVPSDHSGRSNGELGVSDCGGSSSSRPSSAVDKDANPSECMEIDGVWCFHLLISLRHLPILSAFLFMTSPNN